MKIFAFWFISGRDGLAEFYNSYENCWTWMIKVEQKIRPKEIERWFQNLLHHSSKICVSKIKDYATVAGTYYYPFQEHKFKNPTWPSQLHIMWSENFQAKNWQSEVTKQASLPSPGLKFHLCAKKTTHRSKTDGAKSES